MDALPELMQQLLNSLDRDTVVDAKSAEEYFETVCLLESQIKEKGCEFSTQKHVFSFLHAIGGIFAGLILNAGQKNGKPITAPERSYFHAWRTRGNNIHHLNDDSTLQANPSASIAIKIESSLLDQNGLQITDFPPLLSPADATAKTVLFAASSAPALVSPVHEPKSTGSDSPKIPALKKEGQPAGQMLTITPPNTAPPAL